MIRSAHTLNSPPTGELVKTKNWGLLALLTLGLAFGAGCDDGVPTPADMLPGGEGGNGNEMGPEGGMGGDGGDMGMGTPCFDESECPTGQYCDIPEGAFSGECRQGCNDNSDCADGDECNTDTHACETPPCTGDSDCPEGRCDMAADPPACVDSECSTIRPCELDENGRSQQCNEAGECEALFACCSEAGDCSVALDGACEGTQLVDALSCEPNPCGEPCPGGDVDCGPNQFCSPNDGLCQDGCRLEEGSCPEGQSCDEDTRQCVEVPCIEPGDCGLAYQYCDEDNQVCTDGCGTDDDCPGDFICQVGRCVDPGDICDPQEEPDPCGDGQYCHVASGTCLDNCVNHADCADGEVCNPDGECVAGDCRDDIGEGGEPNNDVATATEIELGAPDPDGYRAGSIEGRVLCGDDVDFFSVTVDQGERIRVRLYVEDEDDDLNMRLSGDAVGPDPIVAATGDSPEQIIFPDVGIVNNGTTYYIEVYAGIARDNGINYRVEVLVAPAESPCFPDALDLGDGDDDPENANAIGDRYNNADLNVCGPGDADWFRVAMERDSGIRIEVITAGNAPPMSINMSSESRINNPGGGGPQYTDVVAEDRAGRVAYVMEIVEGTAAFSNEPWFIRVQSTDNEAVPDYEINIVVSGGPECVDDGYEENDDVADGTDLAALPGVGENGEVPYSEDGIEVPAPDANSLAICSFDDDYYCLDLENGDRLEAWAQSDAVAGEVRVRLVNNEGRPAGADGLLVGEMADPIPAELLGAVEGRYCVVVDGQGAARGPYRLWVRRVAVANLCEEDPELGMPNDTPRQATRMVDIGVNDGAPNRRFEYRNGLICGDDQDWYTFPVDQRRSRVCVMMEGFQHAVADLDMQLYRDNAAAGGQNCNANRDCDPGNFCIANRCQASIGESDSESNAEQISINKRIIGNNNGDYLVRVHRGSGNGDSAYNVLATVTPEDQVCPPDWQENGGNDNENQATNIGRGQASICDTWLCGDDDEDWYTFTVPAGQDRTILIEFANQDDGRAFIDIRGEELDPVFPDFGGFRASQEPQGDHQCINLRGGAEDQVITMRVTANQVLEDGDDRLDYSMVIVPTNLDGLDPGNPNSVREHQGECVNLGADDLGSCPFEDPFDDSCWPFMFLE